MIIDPSARLDRLQMGNRSNREIQRLNEDNEVLRMGITVLKTFIMDYTLQSGGYQLLKMKCEDFVRVSEAQIKANNADISDHRTLLSRLEDLPTNLIIGSIILQRIDENRKGMSNAQSRIELYTRLRKNAPISNQEYGINDQFINLTRRIDNSRKLRANYEASFKEWEQRAESYHRFEQATKGLFNIGRQLREGAILGIGYIGNASGSLPHGYSATGLDSWRSNFDNLKQVMGDKLLKNKLELTSAQIDFARELGYSTNELIDLFNNFETEADKQFFRYLLNGDEESFELAFMVSPWELSDGMTPTMSEFATRLFEHDKDKFTLFVNGLLNTTGSVTSPTTLEPHENYGCFRREYVLRMFLGTSASLEQNAFLIAAGFGDESTQSRHDTQKALSTFWASISIIKSEMRQKLWLENARPIDFNISSLNFDDGRNIHFDLFHGISGTDTVKEINVRSRIVMYGRPLAEDARLAQWRELREAQEQFASQWLFDSLWGGTRTAFAITNPKTAIIFVLFDMVADGKVPDSKTIDSAAKPFIGDNDWLTDRVTVGGFALDRVVAAYRGWRAIESSLDAKDRERFMEWFGSGAIVYLDENRNEPLPVFVGLYNPYVIQHALTWEEEGLQGLGILSNDEITLMLSNEEFRVLDSQTQKEVEALLRGGFPLIGNYDDGIIFDVYRFDQAIRQINTIIRATNEVEYRTIQAEWERLLNIGG